MTRAKGKRGTVSVSRVFYQRLRERAEHDRVSMAQIVEEVILEALDREDPR